MPRPEPARSGAFEIGLRSVGGLVHGVGQARVRIRPGAPRRPRSRVRAARRRRRASCRFLSDSDGLSGVGPALGALGPAFSSVAVAPRFPGDALGVRRPTSAARRSPAARRRSDRGAAWSPAWGIGLGLGDQLDIIVLGRLFLLEAQPAPAAHGDRRRCQGDQRERSAAEHQLVLVDLHRRPGGRSVRRRRRGLGAQVDDRRGLGQLEPGPPPEGRPPRPARRRARWYGS